MTRKPESEDTLNDYIWTSGNYLIDTSAVDTDHNGSFESAVVDTNADGYGEVVLGDTDNDGDFDTSAVETNADGIFGLDDGRVDDSDFEPAETAAIISPLERVALELLRAAHWVTVTPDIAEGLAARVGALLDRAKRGERS
ncbi:hypothetical protein [Actinomycetospora sp. NBC_00405]|uniref:hypothetical protein n=1 Tax=Actinomycetospora sp. NBC_00405 TaxID=2975952 RepID=UPI002E1F7D54